MSLAAWYLHNVDQCARLADDAEPCECRFVSERQVWLGILAREIGADVVRLEAVLALLPIDDVTSGEDDLGLLTD
jgi:hypothetical protein